MNHLFRLLFRELYLALHHKSEALGSLIFFVIAVSLFPFALGSENAALAESGIGIIWVCALLASQLSLSALFARDEADGTLEQYILHGLMPETIVIAKMLAHWLITALPLLLITPLLALFLKLEASLAMVSVLAVGTMLWSALGTMGAALTLKGRNNTFLVPLLLMPLAIPMTIFGTAAISGQGESAWALLWGMLLLTLPISVVVGAVSVRGVVGE
jgi:heme exporter protein B